MRNIILIGFMGTGKTTVAQLISKELQLSLVDMDAVIEERAGKPIHAIFADEGETYFRKLERTLTQEISGKDNQIVSTGGGIVLDSNNIIDYQKTGDVVCLLASKETILDRLKDDQTRPLLKGDKQQKIVQLLETRKLLYEAIPYKINTDNLSPQEISTQIIQQYKSNNP